MARTVGVRIDPSQWILSCVGVEKQHPPRSADYTSPAADFLYRASMGDYCALVTTPPGAGPTAAFDQMCRDAARHRHQWVPLVELFHMGVGGEDELPFTLNPFDEYPLLSGRDRRRVLLAFM